MGQMDDVSRSFVAAAMNAPFLEREEERQLAIRWKERRDESALHKLAAAHMRLVISVATRYRRYGLSLADLIQEGHVGLLQAAARFEVDREVRFSTYATWWIRASVQDYVLRNWSIVRGGTSSAQKALFFNLRRIRARLARNDSMTQAHELFAAVAQAIGVSQADVERMDARLSGADMSLNAPLGEGGNDSERGAFLVDERPLQDECVERRIDGARRTAALNEALEVLNARELVIVRARRLSEEGATLEELGGRLGISKERVRQLENRALDKLRAALVAGSPFDSFPGSEPASLASAAQIPRVR